MKVIQSNANETTDPFIEPRLMYEVKHVSTILGVIQYFFVQYFFLDNNIVFKYLMMQKIIMRKNNYLLKSTLNIIFRNKCILLEVTVSNFLGTLIKTLFQIKTFYIWNQVNLNRIMNLISCSCNCWKLNEKLLLMWLPFSIFFVLETLESKDWNILDD